ncbi:MAG TPA: NUDIX domain-containing protein [Bacteroidales bacterium]|nr:NUDIX domain-containing protein [Bacteroidales bacterium]HPJ59985.1 NUDIX domain-containing protein [Bacteroidales bacterium]HPR12908.1 NUDIX domain-containing protein [Bacteroidales bacterium]
MEIFPVVDENGIEIFSAPRNICHDGKSKLLHPVVHLHLFNEKGDLYLQKRALSKDLLPGKWDTAVGGHMKPGESPGEALIREAEEELGLKNFKFRLEKKYIWESPLEREFVYSYSGTSDETPAINPEEVEEGRFWKTEEIKMKIGSGIFTPNFEKEFKELYYMTIRND